MIIAGFCPSSRFTFVSAKVNKIIDAQFGLIKLVGQKFGRVGKLAELALRHLEGPKQRPTPIRASIQGAEQQASDEGKRGKWKFHLAKIAWLGL